MKKAKATTPLSDAVDRLSISGAELSEAIAAIAKAADQILNHKTLKRRAMLLLLHDTLPNKQHGRGKGTPAVGLRDLEAILDAIRQSPERLFQKARL